MGLAGGRDRVSYAADSGREEESRSDIQPLHVSQEAVGVSDISAEFLHFLEQDAPLLRPSRTSPPVAGELEPNHSSADYACCACQPAELAAAITRFKET